jgi:beta-galactosidase/beta-glucuronidase
MEVPRPEYPRPDFRRSDWLNLNGPWQFEIDQACSGVERGFTSGKEFSKEIIVPFPPESRLSGIHELDFIRCIWYRRRAKLQDSHQASRCLLRFGAVDYEADAWVNGHWVGHHKGGYTPFAFDITGAVGHEDEAEVVVRAFDDNRTGLQPCGKQSTKFESWGCHYTRVTGIWQTVWVEQVPRTYINHFRIISDAGTDHARLNVEFGGDVTEGQIHASVLADDKEVARSESPVAFPWTSLRLVIPKPRTWNPEDPQLYGLLLELRLDDGERDVIQSYFGFRTIGISGDRIILNGRKRFLRMVLDQGYYPDGIYTAPSDDALRRDIVISKEMGFDGARLHQKVFEPRFLYWCDVLGYLVAGEYGDWGAEQGSTAAREAIISEWPEAVRRDLNHPSLILWTPFNERAFEEGDVIMPGLLRQLAELTHDLDPTRPVIDTSGHIHVQSDIYDVHDYEQDPKEFRAHFERFGKTGSYSDLQQHYKEQSDPYRGQPFMVSEYGGTWWSPEAQEDEKLWGYGSRPKSSTEFIERYRALTESLLSNPRISGFAYTQLYDVEQEVNGLYTYDRKAKFDAKIIREINTQRAAVEEQ